MVASPSAQDASARYIVDEVASLAATKRLFGIDAKRAATLAKWASDALSAVQNPPGRAVAKTAKKRVRKKKASAKP